MTALTTTSITAMPLAEVKDMAQMVAASGLFPGVTTPAAAATLMLVCQSEGLHPMQALKRYHIIEGRPSMRADAMQAEFQARGGRVRWLRSDGVEARAAFSHPEHAPEPIELAVSFEEMKASGVTHGCKGIKDNWRKFPSAMLRARLISMAVRMIMPEIVAGIYTPEEVQDFAAEKHGPEAPKAPEPKKHALSGAEARALFAKEKPSPDVQEAEVTQPEAEVAQAEPPKAEPAQPEADWGTVFGADLPLVQEYAQAKRFTPDGNLSHMAEAMQARFRRSPQNVITAAKVALETAKEAA